MWSLDFWKDYIDNLEKKFHKRVAIRGLKHYQPHQYNVAGRSGNSGKKKERRPRSGRKRSNSKKKSGEANSGLSG